MSARLDEISAAVLARFAPPPRIDLATWVEANVVLPKGMSDSPGPVRLYPYQRGICAAISDPEVERITVVKSARIGYTTLLSGMLASYVVNDPSQILLVLPTDGDCRDYVVNELEPIFAASPNLRGRLTDDTAGTGTKSRNTITSRRFEGGNFIAVGGHAPGNLRRRSARVLIVDEATAMLADKGEGDVVSRAVTRTQGFSDRKIIEGSTLTDDQSNVLLSWQRTNRQTFQVPCPRCGVYTFMQWCHLWWPPGRPEAAAFKCPHCDQVSPEAHKAEMVEAGQWIAEAPHVTGHVGFWINALVSPLAKAAWGRLAAEFLSVKGDAALLQPFVNNVMAEPWKGDIGDVDEVALLKKREPFGLARKAEDGTLRLIPAEVLLIVVGTDVQDDRLECSVVGFSVDDAFVLDHVVIYGSPADDATWRQHDALLRAEWPHPLGGKIGVAASAVDSGDGDWTDVVYRYCFPRARNNVMAIKGVGGTRPAITPSKLEEKGGTLWIVGVDTLKSIVAAYIQSGTHLRFADKLGPDYFEQLVGERKVLKRLRGQSRRVWEAIPGRRHEALDCLVYALAVRRRYPDATVAQRKDTLRAGWTPQPAAPVSRRRAVRSSYMQN